MTDGDIQTHREGNVTTFQISGRFDYELVKAFKKAFQAVDPRGKFVIDLRRTEFLDSSAIGGLMYFRHFAGGDDADITLANANLEVERLLQIAQLGQVFKIK